MYITSPLGPIPTMVQVHSKQNVQPAHISSCQRLHDVSLNITLRTSTLHWPKSDRQIVTDNIIAVYIDVMTASIYKLCIMTGHRFSMEFVGCSNLRILAVVWFDPNDATSPIPLHFVEETRHQLATAACYEPTTTGWSLVGSQIKAQACGVNHSSYETNCQCYLH